MLDFFLPENEIRQFGQRNGCHRSVHDFSEKKSFEKKLEMTLVSPA